MLLNMKHDINIIKIGEKHDFVLSDFNNFSKSTQKVVQYWCTYVLFIKNEILLTKKKKK